MPDTLIYLDYAATTPCDPRVVEAMAPFWSDHFANTNSLHTAGLQLRQQLDKAIEALATQFAASAAEWRLTGSATESNNWALCGVMQTFSPLNPGADHPAGHLVISAIEHDAVRQPAHYWAKKLGWTLSELPVEPATGVVTPEALEAALLAFKQTAPVARLNTPCLVSIMHGNNEVGTVQPIAELSAVARRHGALFHTDAAQTVAKLPINLSTGWPAVDYLTLSSHKCYGPKGIGALYVRSGSPEPVPLLWGGGQQSGSRGGTEATPLIIGLSEALSRCAHWFSETQEHRRQLDDWVARIRDEVLEHLPQACWNGPWSPADRLPGHCHFSFPGLQGEALVNQLSLKGFAVSSGSACHSAQLAPSRVVQALGRSDEQALGTLRITLGQQTTADDVDALIPTLIQTVTRLYHRKTAGSKAHSGRSLFSL